MPAAAAASLMDVVFAVRQPLSAPTWENPRTILPVSAEEPPPVSLLAQAAVPATSKAAAAPSHILLSILTPVTKGYLCDGSARRGSGAFPRALSHRRVGAVRRTHSCFAGVTGGPKC